MIRPALFLLLGSALLAAPDAAEQAYLAHIKFLASDKLKGRGTGTPELDQAAEYIAAQFKAAGLKPVDGSYFQRFPVTTEAKLGGGNRLSLTLQGKKTVLKFNEDFVPLNMSGAGEFNGQAVFVGYGISAPEYNYDDYAGVDVRDKVVIMLRREPQETDDKSPFNGRVYTRHAQFDSKTTNAKLHGAKAAIILSDVLSSGYGEIEKFAKNAGPANAGIPALMVNGEAGERLLAAAGLNLREIHTAIDGDLKPRSQALAGVSVSLRAAVSRQVRQVRNVVGYLPGETNEFLVVGAHYDHLGLGQQFSMAPSMAGKPHFGADDNASGTAGVIELAKRFGAQPSRKRGILFMTFAGEELGLLGSSFFVNSPQAKLPLEKAVAMINMDMIGRVKDNRVFVGGSGTGSNLKQILEATPARGLEFDTSETAGYGSSDHTSFTTKQVPVLFFFSGLHADYHKPSDTWDKINTADAVRLLGYIGEVGDKLLSQEKPAYVRVLPPQSAHTGAAPASGGSSGYGPYFGSIPDFAEPPKGVRFADVREGSPAGVAGLKAGDIMIGFDGKEVGNLMDFTVLLRQKKPGDEVEVKLLRAGQTLTVKVLLTARK
jgi:hypothetical protein